MLDRAAAREIAVRRIDSRGKEGVELDDEGVRELREGWFFPYRCSEPCAGSNGVIVNKTTGKLLELGSAFPIERDLDFYDKGYHCDCGYLVVTNVADAERTLDALQKLQVSTVELKYDHGEVWRIPRRLSRAELAASLEKLPHVFENVSFYFRYETLEEARESGAFEFVIREI
jgi:hypothetical protein